MIKDLRQFCKQPFMAIFNLSEVFNYIELISAAHVNDIENCIPVISEFSSVDRFFLFLPEQSKETLVVLLETLKNAELIVLAAHEQIKGDLAVEFPNVRLTDSNELLYAQQQALRFIVAGREPENDLFEDDDVSDIEWMEESISPVEG